MRGIGSMLHSMGGGSKNSADKYYGRKIKSAEFTGGSFDIIFEDGTKIEITDEGQSCCENRYMTCDDDTAQLVGQTLKHIAVKESSGDSESDYGVHEICFLEVQGDQSSVTFATHNEHNGFYGGFGLNIAETTSK